MKNKSFENTHSEVLDYLAKHKFNISAFGKDGNSIKVDDKNFGIKDQNAIEKINPKILISGSSNSPIWYIFMNKYANGGGVGNEFYVGQSIMLDDKLPHFRRLTKDIQRLVRPYYNVELVIEEIINNKPYNLAKAFVRSSGQKVPFEIKLNEKFVDEVQNIIDNYKKRYENGGNTNAFNYTIGGL
jgi:hypothetical protein